VSAPRLEIRLDRIHHNARTLVTRLGRRGIAVTGVTKATLGSPEVAHELLHAGVTAIGESRIENVEALRAAGVLSPMTLIRSPMPSQVDRVVAHADLSLNTELDVIDRLSVAAGRQAATHGVLLMVELGDLREGILPGELHGFVAQVLRFPHIALRGIGANLACQSGIGPDARNMHELSALAAAVEAAHGIHLDVVSGGNSANLTWAFGADEVGRVDDLRLGESILLGCEPLHRTPIEGLRTDAVTLVAEVIESRPKPSLPWGDVHETAFGVVEPAEDRGTRARTIVAIGRQDVDPDGLTPPRGMHILGASSDHLVLDTGPRTLRIGAEVRFGVDYSAMVRAMTSPFVSREYRQGAPER